MNYLIELYNRFKSQIVNLSIYLLASLIPMLLALMANPLIAMNMSPEDYAIVGYYAAFNTLLAPLINFFLLHYYTKRFFELNDEERLILKATIFKALILFSLLLAVGSIVVLYFYIAIFNADSKIPFLPYAVMSVMVLPITGIYSLNLVEYRMERRSKAFFRLSVSNGVLGITLALLLVVVFKLGAFGRLTAQLLTALLLFIYSFYINRELLKIKFDRKVFKTAVVFCFPLVIAAMLSFFSKGFDRILLERGGDIVELGYYVVGATIAGYMNVFSNSINDTFQPDVFKSVVERDFKKTLRIIFVKIAFVSMIVLAFIVLAPFLVKILTAGRYVDSTKYAVIVSLSTITSMLYHSLSQVTIALGFTKITLTNKIVGSLLSIAMFYLLISKMGAVGAAWGIVFSFLIFFVGNIILVTLRYRASKNNSDEANS